jgi:hypothetical protein
LIVPVLEEAEGSSGGGEVNMQLRENGQFAVETESDQLLNLQITPLQNS